MNAAHEIVSIPAVGSPIAIHDVVQIESTIARQVATITDLSALEEMRSKADALARYLAGKELHGPMLGAQRRIEARIGQLLGEPSRAPGSLPREGNSISGTDRQRFRLLARGFEVLTDEQWRQSRRAVLALLQERFPPPRSDDTASAERHACATPDPVNETKPAQVAQVSNDADEPERPDMEALDREAAENYARARQESLDKLLDGNDALAAAVKEIERQAFRIAELIVRVEGAGRTRNAAIIEKRRVDGRVASLERKNSRLQQEIDRLRAELIELRGAKRAAVASATPKHPCRRCAGEGCDWCRP